MQILAGQFKSLSDGLVQNYSELSKRYSETIENFDQIVKSLEKLVDVSRLQDNIEQEESE